MDAFSIINKDINDELNSIMTKLSSGGAKDFAEYQYLCGKVRGLLTVQENINALVKKMENLDD